MICLTAIELMLMIDPPPLSFILSAAATEPKNGPRRIVSTTSLKSSSVTWERGPKRVRAALLIKISKRLNRWYTVSTSCSNSCLEPMSA